MKLTNNLILLLIIIVSISLRFTNYFDIPFTHDEFSAFFRLKFDNFSDLIEKGVKIDGHPAGVQVFLYYWTKIFGLDEWIIKLPFTILGVLSIFVIFKVATKWFNETIGLISSAFIATLQFPIIYSQIARPYISGMFFSLVMVYYWTNIIKTPTNRFYTNLTLYILSSAICAYNHHFSLLFAALVGLSGLFFIQRNYLVKYIASGIVIFLLYIPHLEIFFYQLSVGGIGGPDEWLGKPKNSFILNFLHYIFNYSTLSIFTTIVIIIYGLYKTNISYANYKKYLLFLSWFLIPFLIGFYYSIYINPVLQFSVLIFSFPFVFFTLFGHFELKKPIINFIIVLLILLTNIYTLIFERKHYELFYHSIYKEILANSEEIKHKSNNTLFIIDTHEKASKYFLDKLKLNTKFVYFSSFKNIASFVTFLKENKHFNNLYFGSLSSNIPSTVPIIQEYYPNAVWQKNYVGGTTYLFDRQESKNTPIFTLDFKNQVNKTWTNVDSSKIKDGFYIINDSIEWGPTFSKKLKELSLPKNGFLDVSARIKYIHQSEASAILVTTLDTPKKNIFWSGTSFSDFNSSFKNNEWTTIHHSMKLSDIHLNYGTIKLKIFIWNKGQESFLIDKINISVREGNPIIYGLNKKFDCY